MALRKVRLRSSQARIVSQLSDQGDSACTGEFTEWQIRRAANLTRRLIDFKVRLDRCVCRSQRHHPES